MIKISSNLDESMLIFFSCCGERRRAARVLPLSFGISGKQEREGSRDFRG